MTKLMSVRQKPESIPNETDVLLELDQLKSENADLKTKLAQATSDYETMKASLPSFERAVAVRVAQLGIGRDPNARPTATAITDSCHPLAALAAAREALSRLSNK